MPQPSGFGAICARPPPVTAVGSPVTAPSVTGPAAHCCLSVEADPVAIRDALLEIRRHFSPLCTEEMIGRLELVVAEILNNIAEHGSTGTAAPLRKVHVSVAEAVGGVYCIVSDRGEAVPQACLAPRDLPAANRGGLPDSLSEGGYGWFMIQSMVQKLYYGHGQGRNVLAFLIPYESPFAAGNSG